MVFDASDPAAKPLAARLFARELEHLEKRPGSRATPAPRSRPRLPRAGEPADGTRRALSSCRRTARHPTQDGVPRRRRRRTERREPSSSASRLRPRRSSARTCCCGRIVQDTLFPTVCYVAGPNELAYLAQLRGVYAAFGVADAADVPARASATMLDANAMRFLTRHELSFEALQAQDEAALNQLLAAQLPPAVDARWRTPLRDADERMEALAEAVPQSTPRSKAPRDRRRRMQDDLKKLHIPHLLLLQN